MGLVVADWGGMFRKMERAIVNNPHRPPTGAWEVVSRLHHNASGMDCMAYYLRLRPEAKKPEAVPTDTLVPESNPLLGEEAFHPDSPGSMLTGPDLPKPRGGPMASGGWGAALGCCGAR